MKSIDEMIRHDAVYREDDLDDMIKEGMKHSFACFEEKKKGSTSLYDHCKNLLQEKMTMKGETLRTANEGKRLKSKASVGESMQVRNE